MTKEQCILAVVCLVVGFILGRWRKKTFCGRAVLSAGSEICTFTLDISPDDIPFYKELLFKVVNQDEKPPE